MATTTGPAMAGETDSATEHQARLLGRACHGALQTMDGEAIASVLLVFVPSKDNPQGGGWIVDGTMKRPRENLPTTGETLLMFEHAREALDQFIAAAKRGEVKFEPHVLPEAN